MSDETIGNQQERLLSTGYIAGFFDGEGSISLIHVKVPRGSHLRPEATFAQKDLRILERISDTLRANGVGCHLSHQRARGVHRLMVSGLKRVNSFIDFIASDVVLKHDELAVVKGFIDRRLSVSPNTPYTPDDYAVREQLIAIRASR